MNNNLVIFVKLYWSNYIYTKVVVLVDELSLVVLCVQVSQFRNDGSNDSNIITTLLIVGKI